jgi:hypothetical protein
MGGTEAVGVVLGELETLKWVFMASVDVIVRYGMIVRWFFCN